MVSVTFFEVGDRVSKHPIVFTVFEVGDRLRKQPIAFMPGALWAPVFNPSRRLGAQLNLRGAEAAESRQCAVIDMGDVLCITLQLVWL